MSCGLFLWYSCVFLSDLTKVAFTPYIITVFTYVWACVYAFNGLKNLSEICIIIQVYQLNNSILDHSLTEVNLWNVVWCSGYLQLKSKLELQGNWSKLVYKTNQIFVTESSENSRIKIVLKSKFIITSVNVKCYLMLIMLVNSIFANSSLVSYPRETIRKVCFLKS